MRRLVCGREEVFQGRLLLVNAAHPIRRERAPDLISVGEEIAMERQAALALAACLGAVGGEGEIVPVSGWRSRAEQQSIWDDTLAAEGEEFTRTYVALPGCSEHETGLAIDLAQRAEHIDFICPHLPYDGICGAFRAMAPRYGFIERYTGDKEALTGIGREPWHFRYVGQPHALLMTQYGLCLEEYGDFLRQAPRTVGLPRGGQALVAYLPSAGKETVLELPDCPCQVAGDNEDGFVLTAWGWGL